MKNRKKKINFDVYSYIYLKEDIKRLFFVLFKVQNR